MDHSPPALHRLLEVEHGETTGSIHQQQVSAVLGGAPVDLRGEPVIHAAPTRAQQEARSALRSIARVGADSNPSP